MYDFLFAIFVYAFCKKLLIFRNLVRLLNEYATNLLRKILVCAYEFISRSKEIEYPEYLYDGKMIKN